MSKLLIKKLREDAIIPTRMTEGSSGLDLYCTEDYQLFPNVPVLASTGIALEIEPGYEGQIRPRSGLASKLAITVLNAPGTIDSDYRGEVKILLFNSGTIAQHVEKGERIAQLVICPVDIPTIEVIDELSDTERGSGGFGHTGTK